MNITPRPITNADQIDRSRDAGGLMRWSRTSRTIDFIMTMLGWFTIPVEVFLRRDFGQRWFTAVNFYAGFFLLLMLAIFQYVIATIWRWVQEFVAYIASSINPLYNEETISFADRLMDRSMLLLLVAYFFMGSYHLFKVWWRNRTNTALHSFSDGTSRLEPIAGLIMQILNVASVPFVYIGIRLMPKSQRKDIPQPNFINDRTAFTNTVIEPLLLFILAIKLHGMLSLWLFVSAIALTIHSTWRETAKLNKILDFRDSILDAQAMMQLRVESQPSLQSEIIQNAAATLRENPQANSRLSVQYPDLMDIIEEMNSKRP